MSEATVRRRFRATSRGAGALTVASYAILGSILFWTRFTGLDRSYWHDEITTIEDFVRRGPSKILAGVYYPNNHELFNLLAWATTSLVGESEVALRLVSVVPFIVGVAVVTSWLHLRLGPVSGILFLFLATFSPLLLDLSREARGYGLAFLAMSVLIVAALEADRAARAGSLVAFCLAGVVGTLTLPNFGIAFLATGVVLLTDSRLRRRAAVGLFFSILAISTWYGPNLDELLVSSRQVFGVRINGLEVLTAPMYHVLLPGLFLLADKKAVPGILWLAFIAVLLLPLSASPLLRTRRTALILGSGLVATCVTLWVSRTYVVPRFLSFLLVPLFVVLASGIASIVERFTTRPPHARTLAVVATLTLLSAAFVSGALKVLRLPPEAHKNVATLIGERVSPSVPVFAHMREPGDLAFYLGRSVVYTRRIPDAASRLCARKRETVLVVDRFRVEPFNAPCIQRPGTRMYRFEQYTRGGEISVWFIPPANETLGRFVSP